jgi:clan AA aspartic protease (TIGR02281 family)
MLVVSLACLAFLCPKLRAQDAGAAKYSPEVVAQAEEILKDVKLRRSGKTIQSSGTSDVSRGITGLAREKRKLRLVRQEWQEVVDRLDAIRRELERLNVQVGELNLQMARVAPGDKLGNNRVAGLINATNAQTKATMTQREKTKQLLASKREPLDDAESEYAETVLAIRGDFKAVRDKLAKALADDKVKIAVRVMHANFDTPEKPNADKILAALDKRIQRIEREIFSGSIRLEAERGSLFVDVVVGKKTVRMVVDSGASLVTLPIRTATELGVTVPVDARQLKMVLADGRAIPARAVTLPRVRVGEFEAVNVEAAVLDASASNAEPLLGMSFLRNFKAELDPAGKTLKLLRVDTD